MGRDSRRRPAPGRDLRVPLSSYSGDGHDVSHRLLPGNERVQITPKAFDVLR
jgi:hypothetical protein